MAIHLSAARYLLVRTGAQSWDLPQGSPGLLAPARRTRPVLNLTCAATRRANSGVKYSCLYYFFLSPPPPPPPTPGPVGAWPGHRRLLDARVPVPVPVLVRSCEGLGAAWLVLLTPGVVYESSAPLLCRLACFLVSGISAGVALLPSPLLFGLLPSWCQGFLQESLSSLLLFGLLPSWCQGFVQVSVSSPLLCCLGSFLPGVMDFCRSRSPLLCRLACFLVSAISAGVALLSFAV